MSNLELTFEALVNAYSTDLYRYAYWLCKDAALAEDLVQETFMRAWKSINKLDKPESAKAWLFTILRRELSRHFGKQKMDLVALDHLEAESGLTIDEHPGKVENWALQRALKKIEKQYLQPLLLQVIGGYSCGEIGEMLEIKKGAVMTRVCRARQQLRQELGKEPQPIMRVIK